MIKKISQISRSSDFSAVISSRVPNIMLEKLLKQSPVSGCPPSYNSVGRAVFDNYEENQTKAEHLYTVLRAGGVPRD